jgi:hypothetical protein
MVEDCLPMTPSGAARPIVAVQGASSNPDLGGKVRDHCRREVGLLVGEGAVTPPVCELSGKSELARVNPADQQR